MNRPNKPWYSSYALLATEVADAKTAFHKRCNELGHAADRSVAEFHRDLVARTVRESNWQEGVELEIGRTRELAALAMDDLRFEDDARLDLEGIVDAHRQRIVQLKRQRASAEEIATMSLARAHVVLQWIARELSSRQAASLAVSLKEAEGIFSKRQQQDGMTIPPEMVKGFELVRSLQQDQTPVYGPLRGAIGTAGELLTRLLSSDYNSLLSPMDARYIHALHRIAMMGVIPSHQLGRWRRGMVHVGNPDVIFAPPHMVDALMIEFCDEFPTILPTTVKYDPLMVSARTSYRFVRIHPYIDGNGRVSRLLMNLVLWGHHPLVSLAPRAKERHRYRQAILRADRGKIEPLACLIAISVRDTYRRMLEALEGSSGAN